MATLIWSFYFDLTVKIKAYCLEPEKSAPLMPILFFFCK